MALLDRSSDEIAWLGSIQIFLLFFVGTLSGRLTDAGYFRYVFATGALLTVTGIFASSVCTSYWKLLLSQGICTGTGNGCLFTPSLAVIATYFTKKRALAFGVCATGTAAGGLIFPIIAREWMPKIDLGWTLRSMGLVQLWALIVANLMLKAKIAPNRDGAWADWQAFKEMEYTCFASSNFFVSVQEKHRAWRTR